MNQLIRSPAFRRYASLMTFAVVLSLHFVWRNVFPETQPAQEGWITVRAAETVDWWNRYATGGHYWLGYAYALSIGFAVYALLLYIGSRDASSARFAIGGISFSGILAVFGCFLIGCCGSPMLGVYLSLFGASFLPFAKPLIALITTVFIVLSWLWLRRKYHLQTGSNCKC